ncbi:MAG: hypothetical protein BWY79_01494 [Actinobacteria bacterium ADurb.Bin444]|nr:MAG: hypothetical protein BWY79_01494 [Actinobacteria bacterium ADurb.Bin444]
MNDCKKKRTHVNMHESGVCLIGITGVAVMPVERLQACKVYKRRIGA